MKNLLIIATFCISITIMTMSAYAQHGNGPRDGTGYGYGHHGHHGHGVGGHGVGGHGMYYGMDDGLGYGFGCPYGYSNLYPHALAHNGTWYQYREIAPRIQPPKSIYQPGYMVRPVRPLLRPRTRFVYLPFGTKDNDSGQKYDKNRNPNWHPGKKHKGNYKGNYKGNHKRNAKGNTKGKPNTTPKK